MSMVETVFGKLFVLIRGIFYAICFVALWSWVAVSIAPYDARIPFDIPPVLRLTGWPIAVAGGLFTAWCIAAFIFQGRGTPAPFDPPRKFVVEGPYQYMRNPMYVGALSVIAGAGLIVGSPSIIGLSAVFGLLAHFFVIVYEEPAANVVQIRRAS